MGPVERLVPGEDVGHADAGALCAGSYGEVGREHGDGDGLKGSGGGGGVRARVRVPDGDAAGHCCE